MVIVAILGTVGVLLPVVSIARGERGSNPFYGIIALGALGASMAFVGYRLVTDSVHPATLFSQEVLSDDMFGAFFAIAMLIVAAMTTVGSFNYMRKHGHHAVYYSLILMSAVGMVLVAYSADLVMLFVAWELMSIPTYALAAFAKRDPSSNEAAIKYFLFGALASAIIVYAISLAYGITGSTNIAEVIQGFSNLDSSMLPLGLLSIALFIAGFGFKMGLVPFHMWLPDTYEGAPAPVTALLAAGTKKAGFAAALRVVIMGAVALSIDWTLALGIVAIMTMTVGNIAAIMQKNLSRMLAYSSIGHAGYILIGLAVAPFSPTGLSGSMLHIMNHAVMKGAAFIAVAGIAVALATTHLDKIKGLGRRMPITSIGLLVSMLALAGVPPLNGFWSKLMIFGGAIEPLRPVGENGATASPISMYPACPILEYASIRERFFCMMAAIFPTVIVIMATIPSASVQSMLKATAPIITTRNAAANPAFLVPAASSAVTGAGAPSYVSGSHM